jgi:epoxyqueuosine reductase
MNQAQLTQAIRTRALQLGFDACGFAKVEFMEDEARRLEEWLNQKRNASMQWMENHFDKRVHPGLLVPGAKTVVSVLASYHHPSHRQQYDAHEMKIAKYAHGRDYHKVLKSNLKKLFQYIGEINGGVEGRFFTDSAPVLDKAWAVRAGLGWIGKHSNLINKELGSYLFIGELIIDIPLSYSQTETDHCGTCTRCIDACPTNAIYEPYRVDATKCISYLTIEHRESFNDSQKEMLNNWIFGCDICQDVCPWTRHSQISNFVDLHPRERLTSITNEQWELLTPEQFDQIFEGSAVKRTKYSGLSRNIKAVKEKGI